MTKRSWTKAGARKAVTPKACERGNGVFSRNTSLRAFPILFDLVRSVLMRQLKNSILRSV